MITALDMSSFTPDQRSNKIIKKFNQEAQKQTEVSRPRTSRQNQTYEVRKTVFEGPTDQNMT